MENSELRILNEILFENEPTDLEKENNNLLKECNSNEIARCELDSTTNCLSVKPNGESKQHLTDANGLSKSPSCTEISMRDNTIDNTENNVSPKATERVVVESGQNLTKFIQNTQNNTENTPMPSPDGSTIGFGEESNIPSVSSLFTDPNFTSSPNPCSSDEPCTPRRPRKRKYSKRKDTGRLREQFNEEWRDSKRKILKNSGKPYNSRDGKQRQGKSLEPSCKNSCKLKCFDRLNEDTRKKIFENFWAIGDHSKQYDFILRYVVKINKKRTVTHNESRRLFTYIYHLPCEENNLQSKLVVCKKMFLNTLSCGPKMIRTALSKSDEKDNFTLLDKRGYHSHHVTSVNEEMKKSVCDHVRSFEPVSSHYCRKDSSKLYLDGTLSFPRMFNLYKEWFDSSKYDTKCESLRQYRDIINKHINLGFHRPKKDQCHVCHSFKNGPATEEQKQVYEIHITNKNQARALKEADKRESQNNTKIFCATYDLQKVLLAPSGGISLFYYCKRLRVHNLSVFDIGNLVGTCYLWNEQIAMKGSNEIASCVYDMILKKANDGCDDFRFWSDNCTGQNRNRIMFFMYIYAAKNTNVNVKHSFLEKGHTQNEGDSIHATIEKASKFKNIYTPSEWSSLIRWAKVKGTPYTVIETTQSMIYDFKKMQTNACYNWNKNSVGDKIQWTKIRQVRASKDTPYVLFYKYDLSDDAVEFNINITTTSIRTRRQVVERLIEVPLTLCYNNLLPIAQSKKKDLLHLCRKNIIPPAYHSYYESLVVSQVNNVNTAYESGDSDED